MALVVTAALLAGGVVTAVMMRQSHDALREQIIANDLASADLAAEFAHTYIDGTKISMELFARRASVEHAVTSGNFSMATPELQEFLRINNRLDGCSLFDVNGVNRATGNVPAIGVGNYSGDREWFRKVMATGKPYLGVPVLSRGTKRPAVPYAVPILDRKKRVRAVLVGGISLAALSDALEKLQTGISTRVSLIERRQGGMILAHPDRKRLLTSPSGRNHAVERLLQGERGAMETPDSTGKLNLAVFAPVPNLPWGVLILEPSHAAFAPLAASASHSLMSIGLLLLCTTVASGWLARRLTRPLSDLRAAANTFATGDLTRRLNFTRRDEIGDLGRTFDHMAAALAERSAELESANIELREQNQRVQEADRLKSEFLANMSHELRTPLNAIIGFAELMHDGKVGPVSAEHKEYLGDILTSGRHLLELINDVLDLAKIEAGRLEFTPAPVKLEEIIAEVCQILQALTAQKNQVVITEVSAAVEEVVIDPAKLKQVLYNYLSNAIKFTPEEGRITVRALAQGADYFRLEVEDTGIGIPAQDMEKLFTQFQQLDLSAGKKHQGTGLGLALAKRIVEAQGGTVGAQSSLNHGSLFYAVLPRAAAAQQPVEQPPSSSAVSGPGRAAILVVEDNENDCIWVTQILADAGYAVDSATTGADALAKIEARSYSAILLDLILPDMVGWDVLNAARKTALNAHAPVIIITVVSEREVARGFLVHDCLAKPVSPDALIGSLRRAEVLPNGSTKRVLVVDDDYNALRLAAAALRSSGYEVVCQDSAQAGLSVAANSDFSAVVLDLLMPGIDGFEFLDRFREIAVNRTAPVVIWTNKDVTVAERERLKRAAQAIALKSTGGFDAVLRELQRLSPVDQPSGARPSSANQES
jgi:signal transduction histidine kinase/DNA-binding response OmpR family regulator